MRVVDPAVLRFECDGEIAQALGCCRTEIEDEEEELLTAQGIVLPD